jgi:hypothetical protein
VQRRATARLTAASGFSPLFSVDRDSEEIPSGSKQWSVFVREETFIVCMFQRQVLERSRRTVWYLAECSSVNPAVGGYPNVGPASPRLLKMADLIT